MTLPFVWRSFGIVNHCVPFAIEYLGNRHRLGPKGPPIGIEWLRYDAKQKFDQEGERRGKRGEVIVMMTSRDPKRLSRDRIRLESNISKSAGDDFSNNRWLQDSLLWLWGSTVGYPSDSLASCSSIAQPGHGLSIGTHGVQFRSVVSLLWNNGHTAADIMRETEPNGLTTESCHSVTNRPNG